MPKNWWPSLKILHNKGGNFPPFVRQGATAEAGYSKGGGGVADAIRQTASSVITLEFYHKTRIILSVVKYFSELWKIRQERKLNKLISLQRAPAVRWHRLVAVHLIYDTHARVITNCLLKLMSTIFLIPTAINSIL